MDFLFEEHKGLLVGRAGGARYERQNKTEEGVEIPPAFIITDSDGACWTFGAQYERHGNEFEFTVLRDDVDTGEVAKRIVYKKGGVWIFGHYGWKQFSRSRKTFI
jgi:hypothetical protein